MIDAQEIIQLQSKTVAQWHEDAISNPYSGLLNVVCRQHAFNYELWHQEDIARSRDVSDQEIANVKRTIDGLNQKRNDWIEKIDDWIAQYLATSQIVAAEDAPLNTETPGSAIDRLSIMTLRLYHLHEQLERTDVDEQHHQAVQQKIERCLVQLADLGDALQQLIDDIAAGNKRHRTWCQFKMYNDPSLNPYLYQESDGKLKRVA